MSRVNDKDVADASQPAPREAAGKVEFDSRGNSVWRWARDVLESTSVLLKRLENKDLALEATHKVPVVRDADRAAQKGANSAAGVQKAADPKTAARHPALQSNRKRDGGGFDPYNSR